MVKKKKKAGDSRQNAEGSGQLSAVSSQQADLKRFYQTGAWAGIPQYRCGLCKFDTLHEHAIIDHLREVHLIGKIPPTVAETSTNHDQETNQGADGDLNGVFEVELKEVSTTFDEQGNEHKTFTIKE